MGTPNEPVVRLFFIRSDTVDGDSMDLLVRAVDAEEAKTFWLEYYELEPEDMPIYVSEVPDLPAVGAIPWDSITQTQ